MSTRSCIRWPTSLRISPKVSQPRRRSAMRWPRRPFATPYSTRRRTASGRRSCQFEGPGMSQLPAPAPRRNDDRLTLGFLMLLLAGAAVGVWVVADDLKWPEPGGQGRLGPEILGGWDEVIVLMA